MKNKTQTTDNTAGSALHSPSLYQHQQSTSRPDAPLIIAVNLRTPANIGAIYRLADATAVTKIIFVQDNEADYKNHNIVKRTSRNTCFNIETEYWSHQQFQDGANKLPALIAIELTTNATNVFTTALKTSCSFVIGSERFGIPDSILNKCVSAVKIPMFGDNGSMNVSHALAICLYEWHRQHTIKT
ncbi:MAG: TrmH family RNA methyltransferase [Gammaproteobacteria bacterium]|nr:TrmH family RNA methyltransferase [Gammaproteobacteria bacterium]